MTLPCSSPRISSTHRVEHPADLGVGAGAVLHDLRGAELGPAVHDRHLGGELRQERRLLHRGVAAAHDHHAAVAEEGRVADRAVGDAAALQELLARHAELARGRAGGDDDGAREVALVADLDDVRLGQRVLGELDARDVGRLVDVPKRSACARISSISAGPRMPSRKPG